MSKRQLILDALFQGTENDSELDAIHSFLQDDGTKEALAFYLNQKDTSWGVIMAALAAERSLAYQYMCEVAAGNADKVRELTEVVKTLDAENIALHRRLAQTEVEFMYKALDLLGESR